MPLLWLGRVRLPWTCCWSLVSANTATPSRSQSHFSTAFSPRRMERRWSGSTPRWNKWGFFFLIRVRAKKSNEEVKRKIGSRRVKVRRKAGDEVLFFSFFEEQLLAGRGWAEVELLGCLNCHRQQRNEGVCTLQAVACTCLKVAVSVRLWRAGSQQRIFALKLETWVNPPWFAARGSW